MALTYMLFLSLIWSLHLLPSHGGGHLASKTVTGHNSNPAVLLMRKVGGHRVSKPEASPTKVFDVKSYGAKGDGSDATQAFANAWKDACSSSTPSTLAASGVGRYLLKPITFSGPCKSSVTVRIEGTLLGSTTISDWKNANRKHWIVFSGVDDLHVHGGGIVNGNGDVWWRNSCKVDKSKSCTDAPTAVTFDSCKKLRVENLTFKNSQKMHVSFEKCSDVVASDLTVTAPANSPNTDGIHVTGTKNIRIDHCTIGTGDDCVSIVSGSQDVTVTNVDCGPGHGISIGSLGKGNSEAYVSNVLVDTASLHDTTNGVRIKSWQGGRGYAKNITFKNINVNNVKYPIIIDQNYCDSPSACKQQATAVAISNVKYINIKGTSATDVALDFDCSKAVPCQGILLQDINLVRSGGAASKSICNNVKLSKVGTVVPTPCAQSITNDYNELARSIY